MLISRVPEEGAGEGREVREGDEHDYQTASELYELIAKNHSFDANDDSLSNSDLVILYKNIDLGTRLMSDATELKASSRPNQRVESMVHAGDAESDSDADELSSSHLAPADVFLINKERLDLLNNVPSLENALCHKFGDLEIKMSNLGADVLFKTATVKEQLNNLMSSSPDLSSTVLPSSLLDYICCKRLEDNYNFYMENIIRYVKHTIEQLKRISNGDYLTDRAKEKWREIAEENTSSDANKTILASSTSIPLHVERKQTGRITTWDDIVHSEIDIRSLTKILEKKICLEIPKVICGSYRLFSKQCADNLIISCEKRARKKVDKKDSRVDVVLKLKRSKSGHVISNIDSIMILPSPQNLTRGPVIAVPVLKSVENRDEPKIIELNNDINVATENIDADDNSVYAEVSPRNSVNTFAEYNLYRQENRQLSELSLPPRDFFDHRTGVYTHHQEASFSTTPDELSISMQRLDIQSSLPEESIEDMQEYQVSKKKSQTKVRIKSPYENKSHLIDEKKRKKLLEIRERREKKKMALSESCKIMKHRHGKGTLTPQPSSSVTKLSITNKSFYNSIYGQTATTIDNKQKSKVRKGRKESEAETFEEQFNEEADVSQALPVDQSKKYTSRNYYLDDPETETMMFMQKGEGLSGSASSAISAELAANLSLLTQQLAPSVDDFSDPDERASLNTNYEDSSDKSPSPIRRNTQVVHQTDAKKSEHDVVPANSPTLPKASDEKSDVTEISSLECRKSIEKLYGLLKKIGKGDQTENNASGASPNLYTGELAMFRESSTVQGSDSGTSLKHHLTSTDTSSFSFHKPVNAATMYETTQQITHRSTGVVTTSVTPKVIISTKCQTKTEPEKLKKEHKKVAFTAPKVIPDNPLKAISQLLHEFDNAQKNRHKSADERPGKLKKESHVAVDRAVRQSPVGKSRASRLDQHLRAEPARPAAAGPRERRPPAAAEPRQPAGHDKYDRGGKKKMAEIIDEVKEARGEAVRGPSKNSRLNTLAQPKKSYVQAHSDEYQWRYGRSLAAERQQRLAAARPRVRRAEPRAPSPPKPAPTIDVAGRPQRSSSNSPASKRSPDSASKHSHAPEVPGNLKNKMVAVESYVKSHYGRAGPPPGEPLVANKSRVPMLPSDIDLASLTTSRSNEESGAIGSELHNIIDTMMKKAPPLSALSEGAEEESAGQVFGKEDLSKNEDHLLPMDSGISDIFKDDIHTAVEDYQGHTDSCILANSETQHDLRQYSSSTELQRLEKALYRQMSIGNFQKRLRIKNLTITPKQSMQHVVVVQSGDAGSVMLKTSISQDFDLKNCLFSNNIAELKKMPVLANTTWRRSPIPMQVSTVGYAFPKYNTKANPKINKMMSALMSNSNHERVEIRSEDNLNMSKNTRDYTCQTFKGQLSSDEISTYPQSCSEARGTSCDDDRPGEVAGVTESITTDEQNELRLINNQDAKKEIPKLNIGAQTNIIATELSRKDVSYTKITKAEDIEYTTSLDMLVGLLNEIQKITQAQVINLTDDNAHCRELETILNNAATLETGSKSPNELVTITALDTSRMLESSPSSYSFYVTKSEDRQSKGRRDSEILRKEKPTFVDKEVCVDVQSKQYMNSFNDVPSGFFPITINTSTSVTSSLVGVLSESKQSIYSCKDVLYPDAFNSQNRILELSTDVVDCEACVLNDEKMDEAVTETPEVEVVKKVRRVETRKRLERVRRVEFSGKSEGEWLLRVKRDVLVTLYSALVLCVFAALSLPAVLRAPP